MSAALKIAADLSLPGDAVTQTFAFLARRGAGKTYAGSVLAEELVAAGFPVVILDPVGVWWGLRSHYPVVILGGSHGDIPLEPHAGRALAGWLIREHRPTVFDLSRFGEGEMVRFVADLADEFYRKTDGTPTHWILDEADEFAPQGGQTTGGAMPACLGAVQRLTRRGRARGIGVTVITQRSAVLNKSVLTQTECLIAMQMTAPQDIGAVEEWWKYQGDKESRKAVVDDLPFLPTGTAFVYSPGWLRTLQKVKFRKRHSFDSSSTPKPGEKPKAPPSLESLDLDALRGAIGKAADEAKANDPKELRKRIAELEKQLRERPTEKVSEPVRVPFLENGQLDSLEGVVRALRDQTTSVAGVADKLMTTMADVLAAQRSAAPAGRVSGHARETLPTHAKTPAIPAVSGGLKNGTVRETLPAGDLTRPQQAILDTVLMLGSRGIPVNRDCVARWLDVHPDTGSHKSNLGRLRADGYLDGFVLTEKGRSAAREQPTGLDAALAALPDEPKRRMLRAVVDAKRPLNRQELADILGVHPDTGSHKSNLGRLRIMGLVTARGSIDATPGAFR